MDYKTKKLTNAQVSITLKASANDVARAYDAAYEKAKARVKIPGFRPGKAPIELVEKQLGDSVADDAARALISEFLEAHLEKLDPRPISLPMFSAESFDKKSGAVFQGTYDTFPEIKLGKFKKVKATLDYAGVPESMVEDKLKEMQKQGAIMKTREEASIKDDEMEMTITIRSGGKKLFNRKGFFYKVGNADVFPGLAENSEGLKGGETKTYTIDVDATFHDPTYAGKSVEVTMEVERVVYYEYPELNDDFAKDQGEYENLAALKTKIRNDIKTEGDEHFKEHTKAEILNAVIADSKVTVPPSMIEEEFERRVQTIRRRLQNEKLSLQEIANIAGKSVEEFQNEVNEASLKTVTESLILQEISKQEKIKPTEKDVREELQKMLRFGNDAELDRFLENEKIRDQADFSATLRLTLDYLFDHADIKKGKEIDLTKHSHDHSSDDDHDHDHDEDA